MKWRSSVLRQVPIKVVFYIKICGLSGGRPRILYSISSSTWKELGIYVFLYSKGNKSYLQST